MTPQPRRTPLRAPRRTLRRHRALTAALAAAATVVATLASAAPASAANPATPGNFTGHGFDQCLAPTQGAMNAWLKSSPFLAAGIYIAGDSRGCRNQPNLTPSWVGTQLRKGWRLLPITLGPQASCHPSFPRYSDDHTINARPGRNGSYPRARKQDPVLGRPERGGGEAARHRPRQHPLVRPRGLRPEQHPLPRVGARLPLGVDHPAAHARLRLGRLLQRRLGHQDARRRPGQPAEGVHAPGPDLDRPLGRARQHPDRLHPRRRLAPRRPDEAVPAAASPRPGAASRSTSTATGWTSARGRTHPRSRTVATPPSTSATTPRSSPAPP